MTATIRWNPSVSANHVGGCLPWGIELPRCFVLDALPRIGGDQPQCSYTNDDTELDECNPLQKMTRRADSFKTSGQKSGDPDVVYFRTS